MKKYLRAMFFGNSKTKLYLWTIVIVVIASFSCFGLCFAGAGLPFAYAGFGGVIFSLAYSQLSVFRDVNVQINEQNKMQKSIQKRTLDEQEASCHKKVKKQEKELEDADENNKLNIYTEDKIKRYLVEYKAKQENYCVLIDFSQTYKIEKCPAYVWSDKYFLFFMLLEKKPRIINVPRSMTTALRYEKGVLVKDIEEYKKVKESIFLSSKFLDLYPNYYKSNVNGLTTFKKNLFIIGEDIRITAPSVSGIIKATQCRLELSDKQIDRNRFGGYFEEIYKAKLLLTEGVYTQDEYNERIRDLLVVLAEHEEDLTVFQNMISQLVQYRMISQEYAEFYLEYRGKVENQRNQRKSK